MKNTRLSASRSPAFTFTELVVVLIILGVLAALAFPSYRVQMLKIKNQEAVRVLMTLWEAQKDYFRDRGVYASGIADLDITIPAPKSFNDPVVTAGDVICGQATLAGMVERGEGYALMVTEDGHILCGLSGDCAYPLCPKMGY